MIVALPGLFSCHYFYYFCHCLYLHVYSGEFVILDSRLANVLGTKLTFWLSACSVLIVMPLL